MPDLERPAWVPDPSTYNGVGIEDPQHFRFRTDFERADQAINILKRKVIPKFGTSELNVLEVGIGRESLHLFCPYEPYRISAALEGRGVDYGLTVVDKDPSLIAELKTRQSIYLPDFLVNLNENMEQKWQQYLWDTGQSYKYQPVNSDPEPGLVIAPQAEELVKAVYKAKVPDSFTQGLISKKVTLVKQDIAVADLEATGPFHFISCSYVMYLLSKEGTMLAMYNMAKSLRPGGYMLINDNGSDYGTQLIEHPSGWITQQHLDDLGLVIEQEVPGYLLHRGFLLRKNNPEDRSGNWVSRKMSQIVKKFISSRLLVDVTV